ncbi:MAG: hypothetical protein KDC52_16090, partial [Ignavibacteriae bacterium]|nr:hypothetical protein [Ignavibacteriota bacterium]
MLLLLKNQMKNVLVLLLMLTALACNEVIAPEDSLPPITPPNFTLLGGGDGQARFRWTKVNEPDFKVYRIYRSINNLNNFKSHIETVQNEYLDRFLSYDSTYYYYIVSVDNALNESSPSSIIDVQPLNISAPQPPSFLIVSGINNPVENRKFLGLSWLPPDVGDLNYYKIYRGTDTNFIANSFSYIDSTNIGTYSDNFTQTNTKYYYKITAVDLGGKESLPSLVSSDLILNSPQLITPSNFSNFTSPYLFQWSKIDSASSYTVFVGNSPFSDVIWNSQRVKENEVVYTGTKLTASKVYYWWVGAYSRENIVVDNGNKINSQINSYSL